MHREAVDGAGVFRMAWPQRSGRLLESGCGNDEAARIGAARGTRLIPHAKIIDLPYEAAEPTSSTGPERRSTERITAESIPIMAGREADGRWWADIEPMPGVMGYGATRESAIAAVRALALRVAADCMDHGEAIPEPFIKVFSVA